ncbi:hypothetical protein COUCH_22105 [Couchioplanes caeruleus]|uniref:hypothetical protein n=1 Tax=Couchioplanes caeruleus TaxID=56438 RepID=UPI0020C03643|nr:hypothetical protein [Couchioplanes caeruleus]UQU61735.1 hypothetical protein COUCH_22105 [Couchioplanes caeruleus]
MSTRVHNADLLDTVLHSRISALGSEIRRTQAFSPLKVHLRAEKAGLLSVHAGEIPDHALPAVRGAVARRLATLTHSLHRAENPHFKKQLREELAEVTALAADLPAAPA